MARVYFNVVEEAEKINNKFYNRPQLVRIDNDGTAVKPIHYNEAIGKDRVLYDIQQAVSIIKASGTCIENMDLTEDQRNMISEELMNASNFITAYTNGEVNGKYKTLDMVRAIQSNKNLLCESGSCKMEPCDY